MIKSKAIDLLKSFSTKEFKEFGDFVRSPFFNKNPKQVLLYEILAERFPDLSSESLTKEKVYERLYPGKKYKDNEVRRNLSEILKLGQEFLSFIYINKMEEFVKKKSLLQELSDRKLDKLFDSEIREIYDRYRDKDIEDDYFMRNFDIQVIKINNDQGRSPAKRLGDSVINDLLNCFKYLIGFSMITVLKLNQDLQAMNTSYDFDYKNAIAYKFIENFNIEGFLEILKEYDKNLCNIIRIYYFHFLVMTDSDKDDTIYWKLKELIESNLDHFSRFEKYNLMLFLESCASYKIKGGNNRFVEEIHELHKKMLEKNLYESSDSNYMHVIRYWKIINNSLSLRKYEWTENFVKEYSIKLHPERREHMINYASSLLSYAKGDYETALALASKVKSYEFNVNFDLRTVRLKSSYELGYIEEMFYSLDSIKHSLTRDVVSPDWAKKRFGNFITFFERLVKLRTGESAAEWEVTSFIHELMETDYVSEKKWLADKARELG